MKRYGWLLGIVWWGIHGAWAQAGGPLTLVADKPEYVEYQLQFASPEPSGCKVNDTVWARYFVPRGTGPFPAVLVLHSFGTEKAERERWLCHLLLHQGIASLLLSLPYHGPRTPEGRRSGQWMISSNLERTTRAFHQAIADARAAVDWLAARPEIDAHRLGVLGLSLGAVLATPVLGQDPRLRAGVLLLGGGNLVTLFRKSLILGWLRLDWREQGITGADLRARWQEIEPLNFAPAARDRAILMVNGHYDGVIPKDCSDPLWEALGRPPRILINAGHYGGIFYSDLLFEQSALFLAASLRDAPVSLRGLRRATEFPAPKFCLLRLDEEDLRPGVAMEMLWFDHEKNLSADMGWVPGRFFAGVSLDVSSLGGSPIADVGFGYAVSVHGRGDPYVSLAVHF